MKNNKTSSGGISLAWVLFIIFLILKLTHVINWSWWWVTSPLWISLGLGIGILIIIGLVALIVLLIREL
jgi:hypothetical protein